MVVTRNLRNYGNISFEEKGENCCLFPNLISRDGYNVCSSCGEVYSKVISNGPKRKYSSNDLLDFGNNEPVRSPFGPRTIIKINVNNKGNQLSPKTISNFERLAKINREFINGFERNLWMALPKLNQLKSQLNIPNYIVEDALHIYISAVKLKLTHGRTIDGILTASLYIALKINKIPRSIKEILSSSQISKTKFMYCFKVIVNQLLPDLKLKISQFTPKDYINRFYENLDLSMKCRNTAVKVIELCKKNGLNTSGKDPKGIAAASLYFSSKQNDEFRTQKQICDVVKISEITLRMRLKEISTLI